jgi:hypothetical protein
MRMNKFYGLPLACLTVLGLSACAFEGVKSQGPLATPLRLAELAFYFDPKTNIGASTGETQYDVTPQVRSFAQAMSHDFNGTFDRALDKRGVKTVEFEGARYVYYGWVQTYNRLCGSTGCVTRIRVNGSVVDTETKKPIWSYTSLITPAEMNAKAFLKYEDDIAAAMVNDGVLISAGKR